MFERLVISGSVTNFAIRFVSQCCNQSSQDLKKEPEALEGALQAVGIIGTVTAETVGAWFAIDSA